MLQQYLCQRDEDDKDCRVHAIDSQAAGIKYLANRIALHGEKVDDRRVIVKSQDGTISVYRVTISLEPE